MTSTMSTRQALRTERLTWIAEDARLAAPAGRWAIQCTHDERVIGWQLHPDTWGNGYASEATRALATWAFSQDSQEIFAVLQRGLTT